MDEPILFCSQLPLLGLHQLYLTAQPLLLLLVMDALRLKVEMMRARRILIFPGLSTRFGLPLARLVVTCGWISSPTGANLGSRVGSASEMIERTNMSDGIQGVRVSFEELYDISVGRVLYIQTVLDKYSESRKE